MLWNTVWNEKYMCVSTKTDRFRTHRHIRCMSRFVPHSQKRIVNSTLIAIGVGYNEQQRSDVVTHLADS